MTRKPNPLPSQRHLAERFRYDPDTGFLYWRARPDDFIQAQPHGRRRHFRQWNSRWAGKRAFFTITQGRYHGSINYVRYLAHRVIWKLLHDTDPVEIDHINGDPLDNRPDNLRAVDHQENTRNAARRSDNTSGVTGIHFDRSRGRWLANINSGGKCLMLGRFNSIEEATAARKAAEARLGYHQNHGRAPIQPEGE